MREAAGHGQCLDRISSTPLTLSLSLSLTLSLTLTLSTLSCGEKLRLIGENRREPSEAALPLKSIVAEKHCR
jgi:hypothetical protein